MQQRFSPLVRPASYRDAVLLSGGQCSHHDTVSGFVGFFSIEHWWEVKNKTKQELTGKPGFKTSRSCLANHPKYSENTTPGGICDVFQGEELLEFTSNELPKRQRKLGVFLSRITSTWEC